MALISDETINAVKNAMDVVAVVQAAVPLKKAGINLKGCCPFHEEKTPSFNVHPERQFYHCFGCGKGGDAIDFIQQFERVDYPEAIRILAEKLNIPVQYTDGSAPDFSRSELHKVNSWAAGVFKGLLRKAPEAEVARKFLADRGISEESAELFGLGFSMDSWDHLLKSARRADHHQKLLIGAGLAIQKEGKSTCYDRFRGRLTFPIVNPQGNVIGFGGRTLQDEKPKFINTPETAIFSKGRGFYGLNLARDTWTDTRTAYIVEGYTDVIIPYQAGIRGLVATLGTALTKDHLKVLSRYVDKVVLVFDSDAAGQKASERGLDLLLSESMDIFVAELPAGSDPDDVVTKQGAAALRGCLEKPREIFSFLMESLTRRHGTETPAAKARIVGEMLERVKQVRDPVKEAILVQQLSSRFDLEESTLRSNLPAPSKPEPAPPEPLVEAAKGILACAIADPDAAAWVALEVALIRYPTDTLRRLAKIAYSLRGETGAVDGKTFLRALEPDLMETASAVLAIDVPPAEALERAEKFSEQLSGSPLIPS